MEVADSDLHRRREAEKKRWEARNGHGAAPRPPPGDGDGPGSARPAHPAITAGQNRHSFIVNEGLPPLVASPVNPLPNAERFASERYTSDQGRPLLVHLRGEFHVWADGCWPPLENAALRAELYDRFRDATYTNAKGDVTAFCPNKWSVTNLVDALAAVTHTPATVHSPSWLDDRVAFAPADEVIACSNGLLHVPTRTLHPPTPAFFNRHTVPVAFDRDAPPPKRWTQFLLEVWPDDQQSIDALQDLFGYLLSGDTSLQKAFLFAGPKRSGKGTIARVGTQLVGPHQAAGSTLSSLGTNFGLEPLIDKAVTFIADARLPAGDTSTIAERILSISGEDPLTIDRKYRTQRTWKLRDPDQWRAWHAVARSQKQPSRVRAGVRAWESTMAWTACHRVPSPGQAGAHDDRRRPATHR